VFPELCVNLVVGVSMNRCAVRCFHWWIIRGKKYLLELLESAGIIHLVSLEVAHWAKVILDYVFLEHAGELRINILRRIKGKRAPKSYRKKGL